MEKTIKHIVIVGGGISGLSLLHYLSIKYYYRKDVVIRLLEKKDELGGCIHTVHQNGFQFEVGPNGFLNSKPQTLRLVAELGLMDSLLAAKEESNNRYVSLQHKLCPVPMGYGQYFSSGLLSLREKIRAFGEVFILKGKDAAESVYEFAKRRFGQRFADIFFDVMVTGIYAGDSHTTSIKEAFPKVYEAEQEYGSVLRGLTQVLKKYQQFHPHAKTKSFRKLFSFKNGMAEIIHALQSRYNDSILEKSPVVKVIYREKQFAIDTDNLEFLADELYVCAPAYEAAALLKNLDENLAASLTKIKYAPVTVVGLVYSQRAAKNIPKGFGYLVPHTEKSPILGVLFENNIFEQRCPPDNVFLRVLIGGIRHPHITEMTKSDIVARARQEVSKTLGINEEPAEVFYFPWEKAIPQYDNEYSLAKKNIADILTKHPQLHLVANYYKGVSVGDCIENAYETAQKSNL